MKLQLSIALTSALILTANALARERSSHPRDNKPATTRLLDLTEVALLDQIRCQNDPQVGRAVNAMLANRLIRYVDNESGIYLFAPTAPLRILGLRVRHVSGFDYLPFKGVPGTVMVGTAPPVFFEIDVDARPGELRKRALEAGLIEGVPHQDKRGFRISASREGLGSYLARDHDRGAASISCVSVRRG